MKQTKRILACICVMIMCLVSVTNNFVVAESLFTESYDIEEETVENNYNKIHFYIGNNEFVTIDDFEELASAKSELNFNMQEKLLFDSTDKDKINVTIQFSSEYTTTQKYLKFKQEIKMAKTYEEAREIRKEMLSYSKEYHNNLINKNLGVISDIGIDGINVMPYSPFAMIELSVEDLSLDKIEKLCNYSTVSNIFVEYPMVVSSTESNTNSTMEVSTGSSNYSWSNCMEAIGATNVLEQYTGYATIIGIYELGGICDVNDSDLEDVNITINTDGLTTAFSHATSVTTIVAKMCPEADFFVTAAGAGNLFNIIDFYSGFEWLIDNGVDVINMSFGAENNAYIPSMDGYIDYQIKANDVVVVTISGNAYYDENNILHNGIVSPGNAYNAITVAGAMRTYGSRNNNVQELYYSWRKSPKSCYFS